MEAVFLKVLNISITASYLALAVMALRLLYRKAPKWLTCALWGLVGLRLSLPFRMESVLSLLPSGETLPQNMFTAAKPQIHSGMESVDKAINPILAETLAPAVGASANPSQIWGFIFAWVWIIGAALMLSYALGSYLLLCLRMREATRAEENVKECAAVDSPFVLGVFRPVIYLPYHLDPTDRAYVLAHERAHIARRDHWWKPFGFLLLSLHWFNPLMWAAYVLLCRDMEAACDERVIRTMEKGERRAYSRSLLNCSIHRRRIAACPLAFGEVGVKARIQSVMSYKKPAFWVVLLAIIASLIVAVGFLTDPKAEEIPRGVDLGEYSLTQAKADGCVVMEDGDVTHGQQIWQNFVSATKQGEEATVRYAHYHTVGDPSRYDSDYYEEIKDQYPMMFVHTLTFDGQYYTDTWEENGEEVTRTYRYLRHFEGSPQSSTAQYERYDRYVLTNDADATWEEMFYSLVDNDIGGIEFLEVYTDYIYGEEDPKIDWQLTLNDVLSLSEKGDKLTWEDFEGYYHIETGSGLYIRLYPIDDMFGLSIGGGYPSGEPMYILLQSSFTADGFIDIREGDVEAFIAEQKALKEAYLAENDPLPQDFPRGFIFASGAGAWGSSFTLWPDGTFAGSYQDSEMGLNGEGYPYGTAYQCEYKGKFTKIEKLNDWSYALTLGEITTTDPIGEEYLSDGIRFVAAEPHGLTGGTEFILYTPEAPTAELEEEFLSWNPGGYIWIEENHEILGYYAIRNLATEHGFYSS